MVFCISCALSLFVVILTGCLFRVIHHMLQILHPDVQYCRRSMLPYERPCVAKCEDLLGPFGASRAVFRIRASGLQPRIRFECKSKDRELHIEKEGRDLEVMKGTEQASCPRCQSPERTIVRWPCWRECMRPDSSLVHWPTGFLRDGMRIFNWLGDAAEAEGQGRLEVEASNLHSLCRVRV